MKLVYPDYSFQFVFKENSVNTLVIENRNHFAFIINELYNQCNGVEGRFILSEGLKILNISSSIDIIINPFDLDVNEKKILTKLYKTLDAQITDSKLINDFIDLQTNIFSIIEQLSVDMDTPLDLEYNNNLTLSDILKIVNAKFEIVDGTVIEKIMDYIKVNKNFLDTELFVFVNLKFYLDEKEINDFIKFINYQKINILFLEAYRADYKISYENQYVIDKDLCEIY